jgi:hypothetical protein
MLTLPIAESTTQGYWSGKLQMMLATSLMRSADARDEPPNFITTVICTNIDIISGNVCVYCVVHRLCKILVVDLVKQDWTACRCTE